MPRAPVADRGDDGHKTLALAGQAIFHLRRNDTVILAVDQALLGERLQFARQHAARDFGGAACAAQPPGPDLAVALRAILHSPDHPQPVLAAVHLLERRNTAPP